MEMINLQLKLFILLAIGYFFGKTGMISKSTSKQMNGLVMNLILPCSIITAFQGSLSMEVLKTGTLILILSTILQLIIIPIGKVIWKPVKDPKQRLNLDYSTIANNAGTLGMVISQAAFGAEGVLFASLYMIPVRAVLWMYGLAAYSNSEKMTKAALIKKVLTHPCMVAIYIGMILMGLEMAGIFLPGFLQSTLDSLAACNTPLMMFVIGTILSEISLKSLADGLAAIYSFVRLVAIPALVMVLLMFFRIPALALAICVLEAAMPAPLTMVMLAQKYHQDEQFASKLVFVSTLLSMITLPVWTWILTSSGLIG